MHGFSWPIVGLGLPEHVRGSHKRAKQLNSRMKDCWGVPPGIKRRHPRHRSTTQSTVGSVPSNPEHLDPGAWVGDLLVSCLGLQAKGLSTQVLSHTLVQTGLIPLVTPANICANESYIHLSIHPSIRPSVQKLYFRSNAVVYVLASRPLLLFTPLLLIPCSVRRNKSFTTVIRLGEVCVLLLRWISQCQGKASRVSQSGPPWRHASNEALSNAYDITNDP